MTSTGTNGINVNQSDLLRDLQSLVNIESPSGDTAGIAAVMEAVGGWLRDLGATVLTLEGGTRHFVLEPAEPGGDDRPIVILAHADTVWPRGTLERMPFRVEGDRAYGPGTYDMKGGIVSAVHALRALHGQLPHRVDLLLTPDEETGSHTSREHIEAVARRARAVLVVEPPVANTHALKTGRKGVGLFHVKVHGVSAHAGNAPEQGASAIAQAARTLLDIEALAEPSRGTTLNTGRIAGGGATNVVPAFAEFWVDLRASTLAEAQRVDDAIRAMRPTDARSRIEVSGGVNRPPFERTVGTARLFERAREAARTLGFDAGEAFVGGGSDGNFTAPLAPTLDGLGSPGDGAHADHEHIRLDAWPRHVQLLAELIRNPGV